MDLRRAAVLCAVVVFAALATAGVAAASAGPDTGGVQVTATPTTNLRDGDAVAINALAPAGVAIYQLSAHLCTPGPDVRTNFDFGFEGRRCVNVPLGHGDVEQSAEFGTGVAAARLPSFRVGEGAVQWVNELGYQQDIRCDAAAPCDVVVRIQITDATVFDTIPVCFAAHCSLPAAAGDGPRAGTFPTSVVSASRARDTVVPAASRVRASAPAAAAAAATLRGDVSPASVDHRAANSLVVAAGAGAMGGAAAVWLLGRRRRRARSAPTR